MSRPVLVFGIFLLVAAICCNSGFAQNPGQILAKAMSCFNTNNMYNRCNSAYRLTQSGNINVPPVATDQFCHGPCLSETHLVLDCVDHSLSTFVFYNRATVNGIRSTLSAACGHTSDRGNFNVEEYMQDYWQDEWNSAKLLSAPNILITVLLATLVLLLTVGAVL